MSASAQSKPGALMALWLAARPKTLAAGVAPVVLGSALAYRDGAFSWPSAFEALIVAAAIQVGTNYFNDWADGVKGTDDHRLGPARATASGWLRPELVLGASIAAFVVAAIAGLLLAADAGWWLVGVGAVCILSGVAYTGGPFPLAYVGLGEVFVFVFFGLVATLGTYYVQARQLPSHVFLPACALGLAATAILVVNNLRDRDGDARARKRTLAVRFGESFARAEVAACAWGAVALIPLAAWISRDPSWLLGLLAAPLAWTELRGIAVADGPALNPRLAGLARFEALLALTLSLGIGLGGHG